MIYVMIGGFLGAISRYGISQLVNKYWPLSFPLATFLINMIGCFLIGLSIGFIDISKLFFVIGFLGGFTTFSTFSVENIQLFLGKKPVISLIYITSSVIFGLALTYFGYVLTT